jgi:RNA polymerase sigma-70 factor, ECF subfamily
VVSREDERLLAAIRAGRRDACAALVHAHYQAVYRFLLHLTRDVPLAEDLTQEAFATAWEKIGSFAGRSSLRTWLHRIAYAKFVDARRRSRRGAELRGLLRQRAEGAVTASPLDAVTADDQSRHLYALLQRLEPHDQALLVLHYLQGLSYREMAAALDEPANTVKWRVRAALGQLRALFAGGAKRHEQEPVEE